MTTKILTHFIEKPVTNRGLAIRRPLYGVGINDANYCTQTKKDGKTTKCPFYQKWSSMLERCYCKKFQKKTPAYKGCSVSKEWLSFTNFRKWMETQDWQGKSLDKDILFYGNKIYSKDTCIFVTTEINSLLTSSASARGELPLGVKTHKGLGGKYRATCNAYGKRVHLGLYKSVSEARNAYIDFKSNYVLEVAEKQKDLKLKNALITNAKLIKKGLFL